MTTREGGGVSWLSFMDGPKSPFPPGLCTHLCIAPANPMMATSNSMPSKSGCSSMYSEVRTGMITLQSVFTQPRAQHRVFAPMGSFCCWLVDEDMYLRTSISGEIIDLRGNSCSMLLCHPKGHGQRLHHLYGQQCDNSSHSAHPLGWWLVVNHLGQSLHVIFLFSSFSCIRLLLQSRRCLSNPYLDCMKKNSFR